ncbi:MAG: SIR2 family protein, partial [Bacteroidota bacterium]
MEEQGPKRITQKRLVRIFKDIKNLESEEHRFCFLLGAGASKSSGIKTGWELSVEWYQDLKKDLTAEELDEWKASIDLVEDNLGAFYPYLYQKRYEVSPQVGYEAFKKLMEKAEPGIGYVILSQILAGEKHNFVITTNFDYLVEDSVRLYTTTKPFTAGHETLAEFISSQTERPTIIKVHRDLFLHPFNDERATQRLKKEWEKALRPILNNFDLLVVGYGGNDGSLMDYLNSISADERKTIYWCIRNEEELNPKILNLLQVKDQIVKIEGFDELMIALHEALGYTIFEN